MIKLLWKLFGRKPVVATAALIPEQLENLPNADDASFYRDSKRLLQRFDEYITAAEAESESLCIELDETLENISILESQLKSLNKAGSWHERHILLKLDRLQLHSSNLKQRVEIYSQNIKVYLNLISKIQDIKAMRMNGLDETKIQTIWLEFKDTIEDYRDRISTEEAGFKNEAIASLTQESRLAEIKKALVPPAAKEAEETPEFLRPPLAEELQKLKTYSEETLEEKSKQKEESEQERGAMLE